MQLSEKNKYIINYLHEKGRTNVSIAKELNINRETVKRWIDRYNEQQNIDRKIGSGRLRKTTEQDDKIIIQCFKENKYQIAHEIKKKSLIMV